MVPVMHLYSERETNERTREKDRGGERKWEKERGRRTDKENGRKRGRQKMETLKEGGEVKGEGDLIARERKDL